MRHILTILFMGLFLTITTVNAEETNTDKQVKIQNSTVVDTSTVVVHDIPKVVEYKFRETNARISDLSLHLYLGLLGLFLIIVILFLYVKWNVQSVHMSMENIKRRQDDLIKLLQMNNGRLKHDINKLERTLYDLSELQTKITKKMKKEGNLDEAEEAPNAPSSSNSNQN